MSAPFLFSIPLFCSHRRLRCHTLDPIIEFFRFFPFASQKERENEEWERESQAAVLSSTTFPVIHLHQRRQLASLASLDRKLVQES